MKQVVIWIFVIIVATVFAFVGCAFLEDQWNAQAEELQRVDQRVDDVQLREDLQVDRSGDSLRTISNGIVNLPSDGIVGNNLLLNSSEFTSLEYFSYDSLFTSITDGIITFSTGGSDLYPFHVLPSGEYLSGQQFVFSVYVTSVTGTVYIWCRNVANNRYGSNILYAGINYVLIELTEDGQPQLAFSIPHGNSLSISWLKVERGDEFTGYVPNYDELRENARLDEQNRLYQYNSGWTNKLTFSDFVSADNSSTISSSNGGTVSYIQNTGLRFVSPSSGTVFSYSQSFSSVSSTNSSTTVAVGYGGSFTEGQVQLRIRYSYYTATSTQYPFNGIDPVTVTKTFNLVPNQVFIVTLYPVYDYPIISFVASADVDFVLKAIKVESGSVFTRFPRGGQDNSSFADGFSSGQILGSEQGFSLGYIAGEESGRELGYSQGSSEGFTKGYNEGIATVEQGTWSNMLSALINLPVTFILSLIHFEILGFDFANVFRIIVLFSLLSFIITKVLKGII